MGRVARHVAALLAAVAGYYAGLIVSVASLGLMGGSEVAPLSTATFSGLFVGVTLGLFDDRRRIGPRTAIGLAAGLLIGVACWAADPELEWCVGAIALLSQALAWQSWSGTDA